MSVCSCSISGSPPMPSTSSSSLTNEVPKPPAREQPTTRPPYTPTLGGQAPHSHQFPRTRKMFDKGPEQVGNAAFVKSVFNIMNWSYVIFVGVSRQLKMETSLGVTGTTLAPPCRRAYVTGAPSISLSLS